MIIHNGDLTLVDSLLADGLSGGDYGLNGNGITSDFAANNSEHNTYLGSLLNNYYEGTPYYTSFDGQSAVNTDILIKYTYFGDANLDGKINTSDVTVTDNSYNSGIPGWASGDWNYDGLLNSSDVTLYDNAYNSWDGVDL